jgi:cell division protein WhiA
MARQKTFSQQIKDELCTVPCGTACCRQSEIRAALYAAGRCHGRSVSIATAHPGWARRLHDLILQQYKRGASWAASHDLITLTIDELPEEALRQPACLSACCRKAVLRALFLTCGSISEPRLGYHLELTIRNPDAAVMARRLLGDFGIEAGLLSRHGFSIVYIHEGQHLADFLLFAGAHLSLLTFESLRVEKEMRNTVNRVVNCDSANIQRMANTAVRQLEQIRRICSSAGLGVLPPDLLEAAEARLANPDLSLKELGEMMNPPLGKSGMNHRLKKIEAIAAELDAGKGDADHHEP